MSKNAPKIHEETFIATSEGSNLSGPFVEGTVSITYFDHTFDVKARKFASGLIALKDLTAGLKNAKKVK